MKRVGTVLSEWGEPINESVQVLKTPIESSLKKYLLEESQKQTEAEAKLNAIYFRMNKIHHRLLDERVSVELVNSEQTGEAKFEIKVHAGDLSNVVEELRKEAFNEATDDEDFESLFADKLSEVFGSKDFRQKLEDILWGSIRRTGDFSGIQVDISQYPTKEPQFKNAEFTIEMSLGFDDPGIDHQAIERAVSDAIQSTI